MPVQRLDHVQLAIPAGGDDRAREFYHGVLGIPEVPTPADIAALVTQIRSAIESN
jgi:4-hydroxyphenylpyruvate dioxygenase-like putative hemolysin